MVRLFLLLALSGFPLAAAVRAVRVLERSDVLNGKAMGPSGPYERIKARVEFAVNPTLPPNRIVRDLELAPRNEKGEVEFSADLYVLKPRDSAKGNGTVLYEVSNRGGKSLLARFNGGRSALDPQSAEEFGDLLLLEQGYTLVWLGWQFDVPDTAGLVRLYPPIAKPAEGQITGLIRAEFTPDEKTKLMPLADRKHKAYRAIVSPDAKLTVRDTVDGLRREIARSEWTWNPTRDGIEMKSDFQPGHLYDITYLSVDPPVVGLGPAGVRDFISFLKYGGPETLLGDQRQYIKRAIGFGISQSGRWLRTFLYYGFNADERGRRVFDGVWADVAGAGRGSFNHRFAQASRDGHPLLNTLYPTDLFPFTDIPLRDPETGAEDGLLAKATEWNVVPKIFYTNGSYEYWGRAAALVHANPDGKSDAPMNPSTRIYYVAGSQHGPGRFPPARNGTQYLSNPNNFQPLQRALLSALHAWVKDDVVPPASRYPRIAENELVPLESLKFPKLPSVELPQRPIRAWHLDYGSGFYTTGIVTKEPPTLGKPFPVLLPQADADGNELGGVRMPEVAVPLATYTGWNLRAPEIGAPSEIYSMVGSWMPFARTKEGRASAGDPRPSIEERYQSRDEYLNRVDAAARELVKERFLLERDLGGIRERAGQMWDYLQGGN